MSGCCGGDAPAGGCAKAAPAATDGQVQESVRDYYAKLENTSDLRTTACTTAGRPPAWMRECLARVPARVKDTFYGCGFPVPPEIKGQDLTVLDLGCGTGRDCFVAAQLLGPGGRVVGVDMTDEQLSVAREAAKEVEAAGAGFAPARFVKGYIEDLAGAGVEPGSVDLIISNCVVNLSPNKLAVLEGAFQALRPSGIFELSDVIADRRLPDEVRAHEVLFGECISGALHESDWLAMCRRVGFEVREVSRSEITITDAELAPLVGNTRFFSVTYRLFRLPRAELGGGGALARPGLEDRCEDYGHVAVYNGGVAGSPHGFRLDAEHWFETGRPALVCGNTALMLRDTWLSRFFTVTGDFSRHYGVFDCTKGTPAQPSPAAAGSGAPACGPSGGGCC